MNKSATLKLLACLLDEDDGPEEKASVSSISLPETVIIRTVTHYDVGRVVGMDDRFIVLDDAAWVASTGRWSEALATGKLNEVEPFPNRVWVAIGAIIDIAEWSHKLPRDVK